MADKNCRLSSGESAGFKLVVGSVAVTPVVVGDGPDVAGADALLAC